MAKIQNISEIHPTLGFTEFDIQERYCKSFHESEFGGLHSVFPFERVADAKPVSFFNFSFDISRSSIIKNSFLYEIILPPPNIYYIILL